MISMGFLFLIFMILLFRPEQWKILGRVTFVGLAQSSVLSRTMKKVAVSALQGTGRLVASVMATSTAIDSDC